MNRRITLCILLGTLLFVIVVVLGGIRAYLHWASIQYFGEVVGIKDGSFVIRTDGSEVPIFIDPDTLVRRGRGIWVRKLQVGDYVIVVGLPGEEGSVNARVVRVISPPRPLHEN